MKQKDLTKDPESLLKTILVFENSEQGINTNYKVNLCLLSSHFGSHALAAKYNFGLQACFS